MLFKVLPDEDSVAMEATLIITREASVAVEERGRFILAVSGGRTPGKMLRALARQDIPWEYTHIIQVDERVAPEGDPDRNLTTLKKNLLDNCPVLSENVHLMPVDTNNLESGILRYTEILHKVAGNPPVMDMVHLGLGLDGHTASLVPLDPVLLVTDTDVALTRAYKGRRRMTLTYPVLNRSRKILWLVTGSDKATILMKLQDRDPSLPASKIKSELAIVLADDAAAKRLRLPKQWA
ncbi:MAG: 6-phosphogluconolactonase [Desulfomonilaceae bacterium]